MKLSFLSRILIAVALSNSISPLSQPAEASPDKYFCAQLNGTYHTFASSDRGKMKILSFTRDVPESWTEAKRCVEVTRRFQSFYDNGMLKYIGAGEVNNEPVLCAVADKGTLCNSDNVLVTLPPNTDPVETARQLMDTRSLASGRVIEVNGKKGKLETYLNGTAYYDLEVFEQLILEGDDQDFLIEEDLTPIENY